MVSIGDLGRATIAFTDRVVVEGADANSRRQMPELNNSLSGCKLDGLGLIGGRPPGEPVGAFRCGASSVDVHRGPEVVDGTTRVLLVHDILRRLFDAESTTGEIGEDGYKVSKLRCGGLVVNDGARHLGGWVESEAVMCLRQGFLYRPAESSIARLWMGQLRCRPQAHGLWIGLVGWAPTTEKVSAGHCVGLPEEMGLATDR